MASPSAASAACTGYDATYGAQHLLPPRPRQAAVVRVDDQPPRVVCLNAWCYVDRYNCNMPTAISAYFPAGKPLLFVSHMRLGQHVLQLVRFGGWDRVRHVQRRRRPVRTPLTSSSTWSTTISSRTPTLSRRSSRSSAVPTSCAASSLAPSSCPCTTCNASSPEALFWSNTSWTLSNWDYYPETRTANQANPLSDSYLRRAPTLLTARLCDCTAGDEHAARLLGSCLSSFLENCLPARRRARGRHWLAHRLRVRRLPGGWIVRAVARPSAVSPGAPGGDAVYDPRFRSVVRRGRLGS